MFHERSSRGQKRFTWSGERRRPRKVKEALHRGVKRCSTKEVEGKKKESHNASRRSGKKGYRLKFFFKERRRGRTGRP